MNDLVLKYICMPLAINTLKHNEKLYDQNKFKIVPPYLDLHESLIKAIEMDFYELKREVIQDHQLNIRKQSTGKYVVNGENMIDIEHKEIPLEPRYTPPGVDSEDNR